MRIILLDNVENVGLAGDVANVKNGFYRNYLQPRQIAVEATDGNLKMYEQRRKKLREEAQKKVEAARGEAERVREVVLTFVRRAASNNRLFGSVTADDIAAALNEQGYEFTKRDVVIPGPLKDVGAHSATIKVHSHVHVPIQVVIEREVTEEEAAEAEEEERMAAERAANRDAAEEPAPEDEGETAEVGAAGAETAEGEEEPQA